MELETNNKIEIKNDLLNEKDQKNFLETTLGKTINTAIDIGIRAILPDFIDDQVINIKNNLLKNGLKEGISKTIDDTIEIDIKPEDLRIDTYRASGAGGQHINKTDSAVRITHIPTGTIVTCQSQRSQIQNREQAMIMLKSKLFALMEEKQAKELKEIQGEQKEIAWGSQIRSYVLHPYSLVKDNRSLYESNNPKDVLDGNLDDFIYAYLKSRIQEGGHEE